MSESVDVSEEFHEFLESHNRDGETMEETLRRLVGGPHPDDVSGILSSETADEMRDRLGAKHSVDAADKRDLREQFE